MFDIFAHRTLVGLAPPGHGVRSPIVQCVALAVNYLGKITPDGKVIESDEDFTMYLLDSVGVAVVQGNAYGLSPYFRASFVAPEEDLKRGGDLIIQACAALH